MSSDEYALALAQKYRLAISMAVLKTKPENLTVNEYINELKDFIIDRNKDPPQEDLDMTACSDDFNIDDDDDKITKIDSPQDFDCDQDVKSVSNDPQNYRNNDNTNKVQGNEWQIDSDYRIEGDYYSKRQMNGNIEQHNGVQTQDTDNNHQNDDNIICSYEKRHQDDRKVKVNSLDINSDMTQDIDMIQDSNGLHESTHRVPDYENKTQVTDTNTEEAEKSDPNKERRDKFREVIRILKGVDVPTGKVIQEKPITTKGIIKSFDPADLDLTQCYDDTDDTFLHIGRLDDAECQNIQIHDNSKNKQSNIDDTMKVCNSITSNLPDEIITLASKDSQEARKRKTDLNANKNTNTKLLKITETDDIETAKIKPWNSARNNSLHDVMECKHKEANKGHNLVPKSSILDHGRINNKEITNNAIQDGDIDSIEFTNTQDTQSNTHYSESQMFDIVIDKNLIYGNKNQSFGINAETDKLTDKDYGNNDKENREDRSISILTQKNNDLPKSQYVTIDDTQNEFALLTQYEEAFSSKGICTNHKHCMEIDSALSLDINDRMNNEDNTEFTIDSLQNNTITVNDLHKDTKNVTNKLMYSINTERENLIENNTAFSQTADTSLTQNSLTSQIQEYKKTNKNNEIITINTENDNSCTDFDKSDDADITEKVPFKILEEMSHIKSYLSNKRDFKDSGYISSQSQRSAIGTQASNMRVCESADSVFIYLSSCSLDVATQDLTQQMSEVLGQIIDSLNEEEIYPKFLEELLNTVEKLLHLVYEEENLEFDVLQKKDEQIQRILLLNKSLHINEFTIEKIIEILQKLINDISDTKYEIQEIDKLENLCYIFHLLEIILPKYKKGNLYITQESQPSQEQKVLKKQDISDIWRKKWFPNEKEEPIAGSCENKCVLKECTAILNKIIIDFMDEYSLIAFSALNCFNLIH